MAVVFVSVNKTFESSMTIDELATAAYRAWPLTLAKAKDMTHLVAVREGKPLMAWNVLDAYATDETYETNGGPRPRVGFVLGSPVPLRPAWFDVPDLRRGIAYDRNR